MSVPTAAKAVFGGFSFQLPAQVSAGIAANVPVAVTALDGKPLPSWLRYDNALRTFTARNVPDGGLPLRVIVNVGSLTYVVEIVDANN